MLVRSNFNSPAVAVRGYVRAGSILDPDAKLGLADFTASALMRGTSRHSFDACTTSWSQSVRHWASTRASRARAFTATHCLRTLTLLLGLLSETLRQPTFPAAGS